MYMERRKYSPEDQANRRRLLRAAVAVPVGLGGLALLAACGLSPEEIAERQRIFGSTPPGGGATPAATSTGESPFTRGGGSPTGGTETTSGDTQPVTTEQLHPQEGSVWGNLEVYNLQSTFQDQTPNREIRLFTRDIRSDADNFEIQYAIVHLHSNVHPQILTANNAVPETAANGDTRWAGNAKQLEPLVNMADRNMEREIITTDGRTVRARLITAITGGYHQATGAPTETIFHQGQRYHQNDWRLTAAINKDRTVSVGTFQRGMIDPASIYMAFGGGPLSLYPLNGIPVVAHTGFDPGMEEAERYGTWNPLSEDHGHEDTDGDGIVDRIKFYNGQWPAIGVGVYTHADGTFSLIHAYARNISQMQLMKEFQQMGCTWGFPCDGDTKAEMIYRNGTVTRSIAHPTNPGISTAIGYYMEI
jgi:hypothetical protein